MKVVYLVNQYPHASHTFIRSEIEALESLEVQIERITISASSGTIVDKRDMRELELTRLALKDSYPVMAWRTVQAMAARPRRFARALVGALRIGRRSTTGTLRHVGYLMEACVLLNWTNRNHVDHVHAHFGTNPTAIALLCRWLGGPTYSFTVHGTETFDTPAFLGLVEKAEHATFCAAVSSHGRAMLMRWTPQHLWSKFRVVRCFPDPSFFGDVETESLKLPRFACVARLSAEKGVFTLLDAAAQLKAEGRRFEVTVIGGGPLHDAAVERARQLGLEACVHFVGWGASQEVKRTILASRALVHPSYAEGLPVAIMEALALGRPVIATYVGGIPELVRPGVEGWLVPAGSVDDLAHAMRAALDADPRDLAEMGASGRRRLAELHGPESESAKLGGEFRAARHDRAA